MNYRIDCCTDMHSALNLDEPDFMRNEGLICILTNEPFSAKDLTPPTAYFQSDGGHGGIKAIRFCPFCGTPISIVAEMEVTA